MKKIKQNKNKTKRSKTHRFRAPILLAGASALVGAQVVEDAGPLEEEGALRALLVGVEGIPPLESHPHLTQGQVRCNNRTRTG